MKSEFFSERNGLIIDQNGTYTIEFRRALVTSFFNQYNSLEAGELYGRLQEVMDLFGIEQQPQGTDLATLLENKKQTLSYFKTCPWNHLFDFTEYVLTLDAAKSEELSNKYNRIFRLHGCKYRIVNGKAVPIINDLEIKEVSDALHTGVISVDSAYNEAITLLANKADPDYNSVIAKASNAMESMVLEIAKDNAITENTLGKAINQLKNRGVVLNADMEAVIKKVYAYACNAGIRHGGISPVIASEADAIMILVMSAVTINYLNRQYRGGN